VLKSCKMMEGLLRRARGDETSALKGAQILGRQVESEAGDGKLQIPRERDARRELTARKAETRHEAQQTRGLGERGIAALAAAERDKMRAREDAAGLNLSAEAEKASHSDGSAASTASAPSCTASSSSSWEPRSVLTVIRSGLWSEDGKEDTWQVDVPRSASTLEVKHQIYELFGVPVEAQRLQCTPDVDDECLEEQAVVAQVVSGVPLFLLPQESCVRALHREVRSYKLSAGHLRRASEK